MRALHSNLQCVTRALQQHGDDWGMIVEDYVENGPTQVKSLPISHSLLAGGPQPRRLMKSIISFLYRIAVSAAMARD